MQYYQNNRLWLVVYREEGGKTKIRMRRIVTCPCRLMYWLHSKMASKLMAYVPIYLMFGRKPVEDATIPRNVYDPEMNTPQYTFEINRKITRSEGH